MSFASNAAVPPSLNPWARILSFLEMRVNRQSFDTWLKPTRFSHIEGRKMFVRVPSPQFDKVGEKYFDVINEAIQQLVLDVDDVEFVVPAEEPPPPSRPQGGFAPVP